MTTRSDGPSLSKAAEILHGGARRLPLRWVNRATPPITISYYQVEPGESVSLHVHTGKAEYWVILAGAGMATVGGVAIAIAVGDIVATEPTIPHALKNTGAEPLRFLNVVQSTGDAPITTTELAKS